MLTLALVVLLLLVLIVVALLVAVRRTGVAKVGVGVYYLRKSLLTPAERSFLGVLETVLPVGVRVFAKVRLEDVFGVKSGLNRGERQGARNRISRKHVDFLLVRSNDLVPLSGIELDDSSHDEPDRQQRDAFVDELFKSSALPLLHVPAQRSYSPSDIRAKVNALLS